MGWYERFVVAPLIHTGMRHPDLKRLRARLVPQAQGRVLEIGIGSGHNLPLYGREVSHVIGIDPSKPLLERARDQAQFARGDSTIELIHGGAERMPVDSASIDTVVTTWSLCSVQDPRAVLGEAQRVLRPGGRLLFVEHGRSPDAAVQRWQDRLDPAWTRLASGCHINRPITLLIEQTGLKLQTTEQGYLVSGPRVLTWHSLGAAVR
ncbi:MAG: class I SAM-dependent methyltransferase [Geminicoccaceae bacterium]